jgi:hypothetical protein
MSFTIERTKDGILTARESWLDEAARPEKAEREKEREVQEYIRQLRELNEKREAEILKRDAEIVAVRERARHVEARTREQVKAEHTAQIEREFRALAEQWYLGTMFRSSYLDKILHPAYQKILTLGVAVVPFILRELKDAPSDWFWALRTLTDADPTTPDQAGNMEAMAEAWLAWGRERGLIE